MVLMAVTSDSWARFILELPESTDFWRGRVVNITRQVPRPYPDRARQGLPMRRTFGHRVLALAVFRDLRGLVMLRPCVLYSLLGRRVALCCPHLGTIRS